MAKRLYHVYRIDPKYRSQTFPNGVAFYRGSTFSLRRAIQLAKGGPAVPGTLTLAIGKRPPTELIHKNEMTPALTIGDCAIYTTVSHTNLKTCRVCGTTDSELLMAKVGHLVTKRRICCTCAHKEYGPSCHDCLYYRKTVEERSDGKFRCHECEQKRWRRS